MIGCILSFRRTGSVMLTHYLKTHEELTSMGEIPFIPKDTSKKMGLPPDLPAPNFFLELNQQNIYDQVSKHNFVFQLKYGAHDDNNINGTQIKIDDFIAWSDSPCKDMKIIHLIRKNYFTCAISNEILAQGSAAGRTAHDWVGGKDIYNKKLILNSSRIRQYMKYLDSSVRKWESLVKNYNDVYTVAYEDLVSEDNIMKEEESNKLCDFLEVSRQKLTCNKTKLNPPDYENYILNWEDEIKPLADLPEAKHIVHI